MNKEEVFGEFVSAFPINQIQSLDQTPTLNQISQNINNYIIDNNTLYKKLLEIEIEIKNLKNMVNNLKYHVPINHIQNLPSSM